MQWQLQGIDCLVHLVAHGSKVIPEPKLLPMPFRIEWDLLFSNREASQMWYLDTRTASASDNFSVRIQVKDRKTYFAARHEIIINYCAFFKRHSLVMSKHKSTALCNCE